MQEKRKVLSWGSVYSSTKSGGMGTGKLPRAGVWCHLHPQLQNSWIWLVVSRLHVPSPSTTFLNLLSDILSYTLVQQLLVFSHFFSKFQALQLSVRNRVKNGLWSLYHGKEATFFFCLFSLPGSSSVWTNLEKWIWLQNDFFFLIFLFDRPSLLHLLL